MSSKEAKQEVIKAVLLELSTLVYLLTLCYIFLMITVPSASMSVYALVHFFPVITVQSASIYYYYLLTLWIQFFPMAALCRVPIYVIMLYTGCLVFPVQNCLKLLVFYIATEIDWCGTKAYDIYWYPAHFHPGPRGTYDIYHLAKEWNYIDKLCFKK